MQIPRGVTWPESLEGLLAAAQVAPVAERIKYRDAIARFGEPAIDAVAPWLTDHRLGHFAAQVIWKAGDLGRGTRPSPSFATRSTIRPWSHPEMTSDCSSGSSATSRPGRPSTGPSRARSHHWRGRAGPVSSRVSSRRRTGRSGGVAVAGTAWSRMCFGRCASSIPCSSRGPSTTARKSILRSRTATSRRATAPRDFAPRSSWCTRTAPTSTTLMPSER